MPFSPFPHIKAQNERQASKLKMKSQASAYQQMLKTLKTQAIFGRSNCTSDCLTL
ncbi:hypothetical protein SAMN05216283_11620 [Sunxiuqinia elliptica]|uniref:Uncharacterized protein n=1 Tax=Sunxiuqinia elliptica TaxID=655355 RepID=A0A1I2LPG2_9BACT|nr:hypothetical protein SAMN05216283_11620 [Sunxiuqinia elliptica]